MSAVRECPAPKLLAGLDLRPVINCAGVRAYAGNSRPSDATIDAMAKASRMHLLMDELLASSGRRIAEIIGAPDALVTSGTCASLTLAAAACASGNDPVRILELPRHAGGQKPIVVPSDQRFAYERSFLLAGCPVLHVRNARQLERAITMHRAAAICVLGRSSSRSMLALDRIVEIAAGRVPILVDAASGFLSNPDPWLSAGADLVAYSLGKFVGGPPATGVLAGRSDLIGTVRILSAPHQAFGRGFKIGKEQIAGAVSAVEEWFRNGLARQLIERSTCNARLLAGRLSSIGGVECLDRSRPGDVIPRLEVRWTRDVADFDGIELRNRLLDGDPRILVDDIDGASPAILLDPACLTMEEAAVVARTLADQFAAGRRPRASRERVVLPGGGWRFDVAYSPDVEIGELWLRQESPSVIRGACLFKGFTMDISGTLVGRDVVLRCAAPYRDQRIFFEFAGRLSEDGMEGFVTAGSARSEHNSSAFRGQLGRAPWRARIDPLLQAEGACRPDEETNRASTHRIPA